MKKIDFKKVINPASTDIYDTINQLIKKEQELIEALFIFQGFLEFPEEIDFHKKKIVKFMEKYLEERKDTQTVTPDLTDKERRQLDQAAKIKLNK